MNRTRRAIGRLGGLLCDCSNNCQQSIQSAETAQSYNFSQPHWRSSTWGASSGKSSLLVRDIHCCQGMDLAQNLFQRLKLNPAFEGSPFCSNQGGGAHSGRFKHTAASDNQLSRDFLVQLWVADGKRESSIRKRQQKMVRHQNYYHREVDLKQPPPSQSVSGILEPKSQIEAQVATLLARSNLLITRDIEWANLVLGFEQENRYAVVDVCYPQSPAGFIREQSNVIARQLLRTRRPFVAYITDAMGNELFRVRRPFWWITSSIYAEIDGQVIGVVHRRWHLWRRIYDLYLGNRQFAIVDNPGFWHWTFTLKDVDGEVLAEIDRDWRGFGFEIFTDAGQYVVRFGSSDPSSKTGCAREIQELEVVRPLTLSERAVAVALAISLDNDYFSRHGGWGLPFVYVET